MLPEGAKARTSCPRAVRSLFSVKPRGRPLTALAHDLLREQTVSEMLIWTFLQRSQKSLHCLKKTTLQKIPLPWPLVAGVGKWQRSRSVSIVRGGLQERCWRVPLLLSVSFLLGH